MSYVFKPPTLSIDEWFAARGKPLTTEGKMERRIVASLIAHMTRDGWRVASVFDGEERSIAKSAQEAMEIIFNLDDSRLYFRDGVGRMHYVLLICGNGRDIISDWSFSEGDEDGFSHSMDMFLEALEKFEGE